MNNGEDWRSQETNYKQGVVYYMRDRKVGWLWLILLWRRCLSSIDRVLGAGRAFGVHGPYGRDVV